MRTPRSAESPADGTDAASCLVCGARQGRQLYQLPRFEIRRCAACDQVFLFPLPSETEVSEMFAQLYRDGRGSVAELRDYYASCFDASPASPVADMCRSWLQALSRPVKLENRLFAISRKRGQA